MTSPKPITVFQKSWFAAMSFARCAGEEAFGDLPVAHRLGLSSSVAMLPVARGAKGHPPIPPRLASSTSTPASIATQALAMPVLRVLWKWARSGSAGG